MLTVADLFVAAREQGIRRTGEIDDAVLEADGRISFFTSEEGADQGAPEEPLQGRRAGRAHPARWSC